MLIKLSKCREKFVALEGAIHKAYRGGEMIFFKTALRYKYKINEIRFKLMLFARHQSTVLLLF